MESPKAPVQQLVSRSSGSLKEKSEKQAVDEEQVYLAKDDEPTEEEVPFTTKCKPFILGALALLILGWWISATILEATRHRW